MSYVSREEAIKCVYFVFDEHFGDICVSTTNKYALAQDKAISDMEKMQKIEKLFEPKTFGEYPSSYEEIGKEVEKILKGESN